MGTPYDPDIQDAPLYPIDISIKNNDNQELPYVVENNGKIEFSIVCTVYIPDRFWANQFEGQDNFVYFTALNNYQVVAQRVGRLPDGEHFAQYKVPFSINEVSDIDELNLQFAYTSKHPGESGLGESLRIGRFFYTIIPVGSADNEK